MMQSALRGENVEHGIVPLRVPAREARKGTSRGNTLDIHDD